MARSSTGIPLVPLLLGIILISAAVGIDLQQRRTQRSDVASVAALRTELDSVRRALARSTTAPDSAPLAASVSQREYLLARREFHVAPRQARIDSWWTLGGGGTWLAVAGLLMIVLAARMRRPPG